MGMDVGTVSVGGTATITFRVTIDNPLPVGVTSIANQGTVTTNETPDEPTNDPDTLPDDDPTSTTVTAAPVLEADKADALFVDADGNGIDLGTIGILTRPDKEKPAKPGKPGDDEGEGDEDEGQHQGNVAAGRGLARRASAERCRL
mgnify:CR=1 FL=1